MLFFIGVYAMAASRNLLRMLIGLEVSSKGCMLAFVAAGAATGNINMVQALLMIMIGVEAAVVAVGLVLIIRAYRQHGNVDITKLNDLRG